MKRAIILTVGIGIALLLEINAAFAAPPAGPTDLAVTMTAAPAPVAAGTDLTYIINVTNNGPALATGITVRDTLPTGVTFVSANVLVPASPCRYEAGATGTGGTVSCTIGSLYPKPVSRAGLPPVYDPAHPFSAAVTIVVRPIAAGTIANVVIVRSDNRDDNQDNNLAKSDSTVTWGSDSLELVSLSPPSGTTLPGVRRMSLPGGEVDEAITSTNSVEATIRYQLASAPEGYAWVHGADPRSVTGTPLTVTFFRGGGKVRIRFSWICRDSSPQLNKLTAVTYGMSGVNPAAWTGGRLLLQKTGNVNYTFTCGQPLAQTPVKPAADLAIVKTASIVSTPMGSNVTYQLTVTNNGPSPATDVIVTDNLPLTGFSRTPMPVPPTTAPPAVTLVSYPASCTQAGATLTCNLGNLAALRTSAPITVVLRVTGTRTLTNTASVRANEHDSVTANNIATIATMVVRPLQSGRLESSPGVPAQPSPTGPPPPPPTFPVKPPLPGAPLKPSVSPSK